MNLRVVLNNKILMHCVHAHVSYCHIFKRNVWIIMIIIGNFAVKYAKQMGENSRITNYSPSFAVFKLNI